MFLIKNLRVYTIGKSSADFSLRGPLCATFPYMFIHFFHTNVFSELQCKFHKLVLIFKASSVVAGIVVNRFGQQNRSKIIVSRFREKKVYVGDGSLVRRFCSPKVRKSGIKGSSFRSFCRSKVRKFDHEIDSFLFRRFCSSKVRKSDEKVL